MDLFNSLSLLVTLTAIMAWVNLRWIRLPATIGVMVLSMLFSLGLVAMESLGMGASGRVAETLQQMDFGETLLHGMLGALLFAGALHLDLHDIREKKWPITVLATVGVLLSTLLVGAGAWVVFGALGFHVSWATCFLFGALISPTDPIAVGAILEKAGVPESLLVKVTGESLFNDGVGVVVFILILEVATGGVGHGSEAAAAASGVGNVLHLVLMEVGGGILFGALVGAVAYWMLLTVDNYQVEVLITLAIVTGGYALAQVLHVSGPLSMVVAGLLIGNQGRAFAMSEAVEENMDTFWELVDEFLNTLLFVLIGMEVLILDFDARVLKAGVAAIPLVLLARFVSVGIPLEIMKRRMPFSPHAVKILTWSGLRGGISVALALSLPHGPDRDLLVAVTYVVVVFSIVVQGLTVGPVARRLSAHPS